MAKTVHIANFYSKQCGICEHEVRQGDRIVKVDGEWCHAECAEDEGYEVEDG